MLRPILILLLCSTFILAHAQTQRAQQLRKNVVAISAQGQNGFGFITGERNGEVVYCDRHSCGGGYLRS